MLTAAGASSPGSEPVHGPPAAGPPLTTPPVSPPYTVPVAEFEPLDGLAVSGPQRWIEQAGEPTRPAGTGPVERVGPETTQDPARDPLPTMFHESERAASDAEEDLSLGATIVLGMLAVSVVGAVAFAVVQILRWIDPG